MRLLVLGGTGATGSHFLPAATSAGHEVTALTRSAAPADDTGPVRWVTGDARDGDALAAAARGKDAVVSMVGLGHQRDPHGFFDDSYRAIAAAAVEAGVRRVVVMSSFGVGGSLTRASVPMRLLYRAGSAVFADKAVGEEHLRAADLDWTLVYPVALTNGPRRGSMSTIDLEELTRLPGVPRIARVDVADFLLDTVERGSWIRRTVVLKNQ